MTHLQRLLLVTIVCEISGCVAASDCDRAGCDALESPASPTISQGIAGAAASPSDVVANGCAECRFAQAQLGVFPSDVPVVDQATAADAFSEGEPAFALAVDERYEQMLAAGEYLVCLHQGDTAYCAGITVPGDGVVTVHVNLPFGPPELVIFRPGSTTAERPSLYELVGSSEDGSGARPIN